MRNFFSGCAKFIAVVFAILFVITAILALLLFNIDQQLFKAKTYEAALNQQDFYQNLPALIGRMITTTSTYNPCEQNPLTCEEISPELKSCYEQAFGADRLAVLRSGSEQPTDAEQQAILSCVDKFGSGTASMQTGMPPFMQNLTAADWEFIIQSLLPPEDLKAMTENFLNQFFAYLNGETNTVNLSLTALKKNLTSQAGVDALLKLIRSKPVCTFDDVFQILNGKLPFCNPTDDVLKLVTPLLQEQLNAAAKSIPDQVTVIRPAPAGSNSPFAKLRLARLIMRLSLLVPLAFLLPVTLFGVRSLKDWMLWWGIPFFFTGIAVLVVGILLLPVLNLLWTNFLLPRFPAYLPTELAAVLHDLVVAILRTFRTWVLLQAAILTILGLGAWIGSYFIKSQE